MKGLRIEEKRNWREAKRRWNFRQIETCKEKKRLLTC
jgi:hypothetical protein